MAIKFFASDITDQGTEKLTNGKKPKRAPGDINTTKDVSGIEVRMLPPLIIDNRTTPVWPFPGYAKLYCLTIVVSDASNQVAGAIDLKGFPRIGDQENLPINKTIYYWQSTGKKDKAPNQIHIMTSVIKSKQALRDAGKIMTEVKADNGYQSIVKNIANLATNASAAGVIIDMVGELAGLVGKYLGNVEDKPIGTTINSYTTLYGDFDNLGINRRKVATPNVNFEFDLVVRDKKAVDAMAAEAAPASAVRSGVKRGAAKGMKPVEAVEDTVIVEMMPL